MAEYIEREAFIKWVEETYCKPCEEAKRDYNHCRCGSCQYDDMMRDVESFESADVAPVRHGRWVKAKGAWCTPGGDPVWECSECGKGRHVYGIEHNTYGGAIADGQWVACPNCGAKMDG